MKKIVTSRLVLRNFMVNDAKHMLDYLLNPRVNCFASKKLETIEEAINEAINRSNQDTSIAVCLKDTGRLIGDLFYNYEEPDTYNIGWNFNIEVEGKGYANESAAALLLHLFTEKKARRVYAYVEDDNIRSRRLCEKLGMRNEGCFIEFISFVNYPDGAPKYENTMQYAILEKEWKKLMGNKNEICQEKSESTID